MISTEAQLLLAPQLSVQGWVFTEKVSAIHHATDVTWSKWIGLIKQKAWTRNPSCPGILEIITNCPYGENFRLSSEEEEEKVTGAEKAPPI